MCVYTEIGLINFLWKKTSKMNLVSIFSQISQCSRKID